MATALALLCAGSFLVLIYLDLRGQILPVPRAHARPRVTVNRRCPYCRGELEGTASVVACSRCDTEHHEECWTSHGRCSVFGCGAESVPRALALVAPLEPAPADVGAA